MPWPWGFQSDKILNRLSALKWGLCVSVTVSLAHAPCSAPCLLQCPRQRWAGQALGGGGDGWAAGWLRQWPGSPCYSVWSQAIPESWCVEAGRLVNYSGQNHRLVWIGPPLYLHELKISFHLIFIITTSVKKKMEARRIGGIKEGRKEVR